MILAARHPPPAIDSGICYGRLDVGLADPVPTGAERILAHIGATMPSRIVTSPLRRANSVAQYLATQLDVPLLVEPGLAELDFGTWEGVGWRHIPLTEIDAWAADPLGYRPGGAMSVNDLYNRVKACLAEHAPQADHQIWITHAGPLRCLAALSRKMPLQSCLSKPFPYCGILQINAP